ncbi:MAG: hypothetical protein ACK44A_06510 [Roseateles sp.]
MPTRDDAATPGRGQRTSTSRMVFDDITAFHFIVRLQHVLYVDGRSIFPLVRLRNEVYRKLKLGGLVMSATPSFPHPQAWQNPTHVNIITQERYGHVLFAAPRR